MFWVMLFFLAETRMSVVLNNQDIHGSGILERDAGHFLDEGSGDRVVSFQYQDPLDLIWIAAARRLGIDVVRSPDVFASWDGRSTLTLSDAAGFDADDSIAQLVFHELCHALVEGPVAWAASDWGLENTDKRDLTREHAAHRVQARLADEFGLRRFLAATTVWRDHYDALGSDPLDGDPTLPAVHLARIGFARSQRAPWRSVLCSALAATQAIVRATAPFAGASDLWSQGQESC